MKAISEHMKEEMVFGNSKHRLAKGESCQMNLVTFYDEMIVDESKTVDVVYLSYSRTFLMVSHSTPVSK